MPAFHRYLSILLLCCAAVLFSPDPASAGSWQLSESKLLTETVASAKGNQQVPIAVGMAEGWCVTWLDRRQRGAILAARIDDGGRVVDPFGIPILKGKDPVPHAVLESSEGCVVVHAGDTASQIAGTLIPHGEGAEPRRHFQITHPSRQLAATRNRLLYGQHLNPAGARLRLIDPEGEVVAEAALQDRPVGATPVGDGFFMVTSEETTGADAELTLWKVSADLELEQLGETFRGSSRAAVTSSSSGILLVWTRSHGDRKVATVLSLTTSGAEVGRFEVELPPNVSHMTSIDYDGTYAIEWLSYLTTHVVRTDGQRVLETYDLPDIIDHEIARKNGRALHVRSLLGSLEYEIATGTPTGEGSPLTRHPRHELLLDAADEGDALALLWIELYQREGIQRLWLGRTSKSDPSLESRHLIAEAPADYEWATSDAAVAIEDGITMVVWLSDEGVMQRRLSPEGEWIDPLPLILQATSDERWFDLTPEGLYAEDGFFLAFSASDGETLRLVGASGDRGEILTVRQELQVGSESRGQHSAALVRTEDGVAVAWLEPGYPCELSNCPPPSYEVGLAFYDRDFFLDALVTETFRFSVWRPALGSSGDAVLLVLDNEVKLYDLRGSTAPSGRSLALPHRWGSMISRTFIEWTGDEFLILTHGYGWNDTESAIDGWRVSSNAVRRAFTRIEDWTSGGFHPTRVFGFVQGDELLVLSSEVSLNREEGLVRRLHMHTMTPLVRTRAVSR